MNEPGRWFWEIVKPLSGMVIPPMLKAPGAVEGAGGGGRVGNPLFMLIRVALFSLLLSLLLGAVSVRADDGPKAYSSTNHIIVRFQPHVTGLLPDSAPAHQLSSLLARLGLPRGGELQETPLARRYRSRPAASSRRRHDPVDSRHFLYLRLPPGLTTDQCIRRLEAHPLIEYAEPDWIGTAATVIPSDPSFVDQWYHQNSTTPSASIQTPLAWDITRGSANVLVAVLDSGLAPQPEFEGRTVPGYNFAYDEADTTDDNSHGTAVTSVLCASANNGIRGAGVDWRCRVMPIKVFDDRNVGFYSWWAQGIDFAVSNGCKVINLSGSGTAFGQTVARAITNAIAHGVLFVTAAGNEGGNVLGFPGSLDASITVGATDRNDRRAVFSDSGPQLDLVAPGEDIATLGVNGEQWFDTGTSFSTPMVAGVCALLAAVRPDLTQAEALHLLCSGAEDQVGGIDDPPGFDTGHGWGRLNAYHSLLLATTQVDHVHRTGSHVELSWASPANAGSRQPYQVEFKSSLGSGWIPLTNSSAFRYEAGRTYWNDDGSETGIATGTGFFRVKLRPPQ